jgi:hypothetical protein
LIEKKRKRKRVTFLSSNKLKQLITTKLSSTENEPKMLKNQAIAFHILKNQE